MYVNFLLLIPFYHQPVFKPVRPSAPSLSPSPPFSASFLSSSISRSSLQHHYSILSLFSFLWNVQPTLCFLWLLTSLFVHLLCFFPWNIASFLTFLGVFPFVYYTKVWHCHQHKFLKIWSWGPWCLCLLKIRPPAVFSLPSVLYFQLSVVRAKRD